jgi:putative hydrolase of the HAD superfamily
MSSKALLESDWSGIDHVLLDLDGTLLDLDFDNHFWQTLVPTAWGAARGLDPTAAQRLLQPRFAACAGTLPWYSTEYWSAELGLDIAALKRQDADRIRWLPGAQRFLAAARGRGKRLVLLTNAHPDALAIKHERTGVLDHFDASYSSHALHAPKEDPRFWEALAQVEHYDPGRPPPRQRRNRPCARGISGHRRSGRFAFVLTSNGLVPDYWAGRAVRWHNRRPFLQTKKITPCARSNG